MATRKIELYMITCYIFMFHCWIFVTPWWRCNASCVLLVCQKQRLFNTQCGKVTCANTEIINTLEVLDRRKAWLGRPKTTRSRCEEWEAFIWTLWHQRRLQFESTSTHLSNGIHRIHWHVKVPESVPFVLPVQQIPRGRYTTLPPVRHAEDKGSYHLL
jgi:hypothetical protein